MSVATDRRWTPKRAYRNTPDSFWSRVAVVADSTSCWEWQGARNYAGYGVVNWRNRQVRCHRLAYMLAHGEIPQGLKVCHRCDNRACCNPSHLWLGTDADNIHDRDRKGRHGARRFPERMSRGRGESSRFAKITDAAVEAIRTSYIPGQTRQIDLAMRFDISRTQVGRIVRGESRVGGAG